jgi:hypothetical protein
VTREPRHDLHAHEGRREDIGGCKLRQLAAGGARGRGRVYAGEVLVGHAGVLRSRRSSGPKSQVTKSHTNVIYGIA